MSRLEVLESVDRDAWNACIAERGGPVQLSTEWCDFSCAKAGVQPLFIRGDGKDGLRAIVYVARSTKWPLSQWPIAYSDCLPWADDPRARLAEIEALLRERGCASYRLNSLAQTSAEALPLAHLGYEEHHRIEFGLSLAQGMDEAFKRMRSGLRNQIRRAERAGVRFTTSRDKSAMQDLHRIELETSQRQAAQGKSAPPMSRDTFGLIWTHLVQPGRVRVHLAWQGGQAVAFVVIGIIGGSAYYLYGGAALASLSTDAPKGLMWHAVTQAHDEGVREFNLGGMPAAAAEVDSLDHGLYQYKRRLGGDERHCISGFKVLRPGAFRAQQGLHQVLNGLRELRQSLQAVAGRH